MGGRRAAQERDDETDEPDGARLLPLQSEYLRVEFGASEKGQHDRADAGEKFDPGTRPPSTARQRRADDQLGDRADDNLRQAVEMRSQIDSKLAISARPSHNAARAQTLVMRKFSFSIRATSASRSTAPIEAKPLPSHASSSGRGHVRIAGIEVIASRHAHRRDRSYQPGQAVFGDLHPLCDRATLLGRLSGVKSLACPGRLD